MQQALFSGAVIAAALSIAAAAQATPIIVTNIAMPYEETLTIGNPLSPAEGAYVGQQVLTTSTGAIIDAWCIDLFHDASLGNQAANDDYQIEPIATNNDPNYTNGTPLTSAQISEISELVDYGDNLLVTDQTSARDQDSAAVQLAIWTVEYPTLSYSGYPSGSASTSLIDETNNLVSEVEQGDLSGYTGQVVEMEGLDGQQSYAIDPPASVPEPRSLALFATALLGLALLRAVLRVDATAVPPRS
jgi:hypothetical protein